MQSASLVVADEHHAGVADDHILETLQVAEHPEPVGELRRQYEAIHERLGHRTFAVVRGRDVRAAQADAAPLKLLWPDRAEFPSRAEVPDLDRFDAETAAAVDQFRAQRELPTAESGLGHPPGLVDKALIDALQAACHEESLKNSPEPAKTPDQN